MYLIPKLHKKPAGSRFIIPSKNSSTKPLSKAVSNVFKLIYSQIQNFHNISKFLSNYSKFWVLQNVQSEHGKYRPEKNIRILTLFTQCYALYNLVNHFFLINVLRNTIAYNPHPLHFSVTIRDKTDCPPSLPSKSVT